MTDGKLKPLRAQTSRTCHSITSSARASRDREMVSPSVLAVFRFMMTSNFLGDCTGRSDGFAPRRIRSMYPAPSRNRTTVSKLYETRPPCVGLRVGDVIHIRGHTTDFSQRVESLEVDHASATEVGPNDDFGLKVVQHAREHDVAYKVQL